MNRYRLVRESQRHKAWSVLTYIIIAIGLIAALPFVLAILSAFAYDGIQIFTHLTLP